MQMSCQKNIKSIFFCLCDILPYLAYTQMLDIYAVYSSSPRIVCLCSYLREGASVIIGGRGSVPSKKGAR